MAGTGPLSGQGSYDDWYREFAADLGMNDVVENIDRHRAKIKAEMEWTVTGDKFDKDKAMKIEFGKYRGQDLMDVPRDYVEWLIDSREKDLQTYRAELARRDAAEAADQTDVEKIISAGYRALAMKAHPDHGGSADEFMALKNAKAQLDQILQALRQAT